MYVVEQRLQREEYKRNEAVRMHIENPESKTIIVPIH
jgi:hypothetical protein